MAKQAATAKAKRSGSVLHDILVITISLGLILTLQVGFIFFLFALLPSLVAFFVDESRSKHIYKAVLACNLAGMAPTLASFMQSKGDVAHFQIMITDPLVWLMAYGSAAGGWMLVWLCRAFALMMVSITCENRIIMLERMKKKMVEEWGSQIRRGGQE